MCGQFLSGESAPDGTLQRMGGRLQIGLLENLAIGLSAVHYSQSLAPAGGTALRKQGLGDSRLYMKWRIAGAEQSPTRLLLRPAMRIPTGYDRNDDGLMPFTSRTVDFELLAIGGLELPPADLFLNAGIALPGGRHDNELLGGIGIRSHQGLPLGLYLSGEYALRYDLPAQTWNHEIYGALARPLVAGFSLELGLRKPLLEGESRNSEIGVRLGFGGYPWHAAHRAAQPDGPPPRIFFAAIESDVDDAYGLALRVRRHLRPALMAARRLRLVETRRESEYTAALRILTLAEGTGRSLSIPRLLATPQATLEITAALELRDSHHATPLDQRIIQFRVHRGTGIVLLPPAGNEDTWVPPPGLRSALRDQGARRLAEEARAAILQALAAVTGGQR